MTCQSKNTTILCFGNSLTAGFGLEKQDAYPSQLQQKLKSVFKKDFTVINEGVSGELTSEGLTRLPEILVQLPLVDYFILELGVNDAFQKKDVNDIKNNLLKIISLVKTRYPHCKIILAEVKLTGMLEADYAAAFEAMYAEVANTAKVVHLKSMLDNIPADSTHNLDDGIHPNEKGTLLMMENVFKVIEPIIK